MEQIWKALLLALVSGVTSFLPVSSSGHLESLRMLLGMELTSPLYFDIILHLGACLAVIVAFHKDVLRLFADGIGVIFDCAYNGYTFFYNRFHRKEEPRRYHRVLFTSGRKHWFYLFITTLVTALIGLILSEIATNMMHSYLFMGIGFFINAGILYFLDDLGYGMKRIGEAGVLDAAVIGAGQGISVIPGISRFSLTYYLTLKCGYEKIYAMKYTFLSMIGSSFGAMVFELCKSGPVSASGAESLLLLFGFLISFGVSLSLIRLFLRWILKNKVRPFSWYCLGVGAVLILIAVFNK